MNKKSVFSLVITLSILCVLVALTLPAGSIELKRSQRLPAISGKVKPGMDVTVGDIPLYFTANEGQVHKAARFYSRASRYTLWLTREGLVFDSIKKKDSSKEERFDRDVSRLHFVGAAGNPEMTAEHTHSARNDIINGNDRSNWKGGISTSAAVQYKGLYKNIDLKVYGIQKQIEYDWKVGPGGDPNQIAFRYDNVKNTRIDKEGNLLIQTAFGEMMHKKPYSYQEINGEIKTVDSAFRRIADNTYGFTVGKYDRSRRLVIDPVVVAYSTFIGGSVDSIGVGEDVWTADIDNNGNLYFGGTTTVLDYPLKNEYPATIYQRTIFVTRLKFKPDEPLN